MTTLFEAILELARILGPCYEGAADSGSSVTVLKCSDLKVTAGTMTDGTVFFRSGALAGKSAIVTRHAQNQLTFPTQSTPPVAGDPYAVLGPDFPRSFLVQAINHAHRDLGEVLQWDETLITVANQEDYTLPTGVSNVVEVAIATATAAPYNFGDHRHYRETAGKLRFITGFAPTLAGFKIRVGYNGVPAWVSADADTLYSGVNLRRLAGEAALWAMRTRIKVLETTAKDDPLVVMKNEWEQKLPTMPNHVRVIGHKLPTLGGY